MKNNSKTPPNLCWLSRRKTRGNWGVKVTQRDESPLHNLRVCRYICVIQGRIEKEAWQAEELENPGNRSLTCGEAEELKDPEATDRYFLRRGPSTNPHTRFIFYEPFPIG
jgi:hypothetical protein